MKKLVMRLLQMTAKRVLARYRPIIVGITGSVGKTSTREAVALALGGAFAVRTPAKNYNNEFGLPLAILGEKSPGKDAWGWLKLFWRTARIRSFPQMLVLEYGADAPGDIAALCAIAEPHVSVITAVSPVHLANYPNWDALVSEKMSLGLLTDPAGTVVLHADDATVLRMRERMAANVITYGIHASADVRATEVRVVPRYDASFEQGEAFVVTTAKVQAFGETAELKLRNCIGEAPVLSCVAAIAVAHTFGVALEDAVARLNKELRPVPGRLHPLPGIKGSLLIDDSYNAAPASMAMALGTLRVFVPGSAHARRIAVLGKMAEIGVTSREEHELVGREVAATADLFIAVGEEMWAAADTAVAAGMDREHVERVADAVEAGRYLDRVVQSGDIVLIKGSQSARMERTVKDVLADPLHAAELLVRQDAGWQKAS